MNTLSENVKIIENPEEVVFEEDNSIQKEEKEDSVENRINELVTKANQAADNFQNYNQEQIDEIVKQMTLAAVEDHIKLAKLARKETGMGVYEDKITKNLFASEYVYNDIRDIQTVGVIEDNKEENYKKIAEPVGVIAALTPVTNPTSTTIFKTLISIKTRNPIIFSFHPSALKSCTETVKSLKKAAVAAGAPENCINWIKKPSLKATNYLLQHQQVDLILATGGEGMVKAAYSSGKPALGVGPGNVPCYIEKSANIKQAVSDLIISKTFDNGMICASEQSLVVDKDINNEIRELLTLYNCYFLNEVETKKISNIAIDNKKGAMNPKIVGQPAAKIANMAGINVPENTKILIAELNGVGNKYPLSREKLSPILAYYKVEDYREGIKKCKEITEFGGLGHSSVIHSQNQEIIEKFSRELQTGRIMINNPSSQGAIGDLYNSKTPSLTLGCGTMGGNSTTDNVSVNNLLNIKRASKRKDRNKWFRVPSKIFFESGSLSYLQNLKGNRAVIITDETMVELGYVDKVNYYLKEADISYSVFSEIEPDPSVETVKKGCEVLNKEQPDIIIALGGGSAIDAAKGMWLFYEKPEIDFKDLRLKFADIRKRAYKFPELGNKTEFIAVPTTSGTGSEVTAFSVITDKKNNIKYPLADYELTPDVAIIDSDLVKTVPGSITADTGMDVLTHAIEAYVSVMASDYTDALAEKTIRNVFKYLPRAFKNGNDMEARKKMHNASCMAGMAFTNAFLGINHSMAHILGGKFHIPHGKANAILMPYIIEYNSENPVKFTAYPQYSHPEAKERYAELAEMLGLKSSNNKESIENLINKIKNLMKELDIPLTISETGITEREFKQEVDEMADIAFNDQCTGTNPRKPLVSEIKEIYLKAFYGKAISDLD